MIVFAVNGSAVLMMRVAHRRERSDRNSGDAFKRGRFVCRAAAGRAWATIDPRKPSGCVGSRGYALAASAFVWRLLPLSVSHPLSGCGCEAPAGAKLSGTRLGRVPFLAFPALGPGRSAPSCNAYNIAR